MLNLLFFLKKYFDLPHGHLHKVASHTLVELLQKKILFEKNALFSPCYVVVHLPLWFKNGVWPPIL